MNVLGLKIDEISEAKLPSKTVFSAFPILPSLLKENKVQYAKICVKTVVSLKTLSLSK